MARSHKGKATVLKRADLRSHLREDIRAGGETHRRGLRKGNQDGTTVYRNATPPAPVAGFLGLPYPSSPNCTKTPTRPARFAPRRRCGARRKQAGKRGCDSGPGHRPWPPGPRPSPARDPPSLGPEARCPPHHPTPSGAQAASNCVARCPPQTERRFRTRPLHRAAPTSPRPPRAPVPDRTHLRRAGAAAEAATAAPRRWPSPSPSPMHAAAAARGTLPRAGGLSGGVRCSAGPPHARPGAEGAANTAGAERRGAGSQALSAAVRGAPGAGLRRGGRGLHPRRGQGRGGAARGAGWGRGGRGQGAGVRAGRGVPPREMPGAVRPARGLGDQSRTRGEGRAGHAEGRGAGPGHRPGGRSPEPRTSARTVTLPQPARPLAVSALRPSLPPREGRGTRRGCGVWADWLGVRRSGQTRQAPRLQAPGAARILRHFSEGGGAVGARPLWGPEEGGGRRAEPPRGTASRRAFCALQGCAWRVAPSPFGGVLALVCEPLFRTGPANENKQQTGHTFQRDGELASTGCLEGNTLSPRPQIRILRVWGSQGGRASSKKELEPKRI